MLDHQNGFLMVNPPGLEFRQCRWEEPPAVWRVHQKQVKHHPLLVENSYGPVDVRVENLCRGVHPAQQEIFVNDAEGVLSLFDKDDLFCSPAQGLTSKVSGPGEKVQDKLPGDIVAETVKDGAFDPIRRGSDRPARRCRQPSSLRRSADDTHQETMNPKSESRNPKQLLHLSTHYHKYDAVY